MDPRKSRQATKSQNAQRPMQAAKAAKKASAWFWKVLDCCVNLTVRSVPIFCSASQSIAAVCAPRDRSMKGSESRMEAADFEVGHERDTARQELFVVIGFCASSS